MASKRPPNAVLLSQAGTKAGVRTTLLEENVHLPPGLGRELGQPFVDAHFSRSEFKIGRSNPLDGRFAPIGLETRGVMDADIPQSEAEFLKNVVARALRHWWAGLGGTHVRLTTLPFSGGGERERSDRRPRPTATAGWAAQSTT